VQQCMVRRPKAVLRFSRTINGRLSRWTGAAPSTTESIQANAVIT